MSVELLLKQFRDNTHSLPYPIHESAFLSPRKILFCQEVRDACKANLCGMYGKCWTCPPGVGRWEELRDHYQSFANAFVFTTLHTLEDSFDVEGMSEGREAHKRTEQAMETALRSQAEPFEICGAEGCTLCKKCTYPDAPCRHPERIHRSMEATGIHVVKLAADCGIHYCNGVNTVTYFSVIYF